MSSLTSSKKSVLSIDEQEKSTQVMIEEEEKTNFKVSIDLRPKNNF